jgi:hypothetical protein
MYIYKKYSQKQAKTPYDIQKQCINIKTPLIS